MEDLRPRRKTPLELGIISHYMKVREVIGTHPETYKVFDRYAKRATYVPWLYDARIDQSAFFFRIPVTNLIEELQRKIDEKSGRTRTQHLCDQPV